MQYATFDLERSLWVEHEWVVACDEVGRGAWGGPLVIATCAVQASHARSAPLLADSKLLSVRARNELAPAVLDWAPVTLGEVSAAEIDEIGMAKALRLASSRALDALELVGITPTVLIQDGSASWIPDSVHASVRRIIQPKLDMTSATCAAASVVAKVHRDAWMCEHGAAYPNWPALVQSSGYGTKAHAAQIREHGVCDMHRKSWSFVAKLTAAS